MRFVVEVRLVVSFPRVSVRRSIDWVGGWIEIDTRGDRSFFVSGILT